MVGDWGSDIVRNCGLKVVVGGDGMSTDDRCVCVCVCRVLYGVKNRFRIDCVFFVHTCVIVALCFRMVVKVPH